MALCDGIFDPQYGVRPQVRLYQSPTPLTSPHDTVEGELLRMPLRPVRQHHWRVPVRNITFIFFVRVLTFDPDASENVQP